MIQFVSKEERKDARKRALEIVRALQKALHPTYRIDPKLVGSARYNAVICDENGKYDMDYQLILTRNCKTFDAQQVHKDFFNAFKVIKNSNEKVEESTSVITFRISKNEGKFNINHEIFSFDFAILREDYKGKTYIIRRSENNQYCWNELSCKNSYIYEKFYGLNKEKQNKIIDRVRERKIKEKKKPKNEQIESYVIFMEEVNNYKG